MHTSPLNIITSYMAHLEHACKTQAVLLPAEVQSDKFHVELALLPHPILPGNGAVRLRLRATACAELAATEEALNECLVHSIRLALFFDQAEGFALRNEKEKRSPTAGATEYGMAYHTAIREDDELFTDLNERDGQYSYRESWLVELEVKESALAF